MKKRVIIPVKLFFSIILIGLGSSGPLQGQTVSFNQTALNFNEFEEIKLGTSLEFGPDERLYVSQLKGEIKIYTISKEGPNQYDVVGEEVLLGVKQIPNYDDHGYLAYDNRYGRQITGITVTGTAENPVIYATSSDPKWGGPSGDTMLDTNSSMITRLTWTGTEWEVVDLVRGLARSEENHAINGIEYTTIGGKPYLLISNGGFTNAGSPSKNFTYISEYALAAAVLQIDLDALEALPTKIDAHSGRAYKYDVPTLDDPTRPNVNGIYDPNDPGYDGVDVNDPFGGNDGLNMGMVTLDGPVKIFSPGYRNTYDLVVTENNRLYLTDNGANINWGGMPQFEGDATLVTNAYDPLEPGASPLNPTTTGEFVDNQDHLIMISADLENYTPGTYYGGHPTPIRANPGQPYQLGSPFPYSPGGAGLYTKFVGDDKDFTHITPMVTPSDKFRTEILEPIAPGDPGFEEYAANSLPVNWPPVPYSVANPAEADFISPTLTNSNGPQPDIITVVPNNSNGIAEYTASNFEGAIKGSLIVGKNGGILHLIHLNEDGTLKEAEFNKWNLNGGNALGITTNGDTSTFPGTIWAATFDNRIMILTPADDIFCIAEDDPEFDPLADYDHDGYSNQDEIDNGTDYCSGGSAPDDYDKDLISNLNDEDDDGDGILDQLDPFQVGYPSDLPLENQLFTNQSDASGDEFGYLGLGLTGLMNNGSLNPNWLEWLDKGNDSPGPPDIYGGTAGAIQVSMTGGTANGLTNTQEKGFQLGVNVGTEVGNYVITSGIIGLSSPGQLYDFDGDGEVGIQIGDGTQSNFIKLVFTADGILAAQEINDVEDPNPLFLPIPVNERPGSNTLIELSFDVDPVNGTVKPFYKYSNQALVPLGTIQASGSVLTSIQDMSEPLAVGIYGTSNDSLKSFIGVWNFISVIGEKPYTIRSLKDISKLLGDDDVTIDLEEYFGDNDGENNLTFTVAENTNSVIGASIVNHELTINIPNDEVVSNITIRATDSNGYFVDQTFEVTVEQDFTILLRINGGGTEISTNDGTPSWLPNYVNGPANSDVFEATLGKSGTNSFLADNRHASIPSYISDEEYVQLFGTERYTTEGTMEYKIPLPNGQYAVNLYLGNGYIGTSTLGKRYYGIEIEGDMVETTIDLIERFGHQVGGMEQYQVTVTDGELNIIFQKQKENPLFNGIEILGKPIQNPITFTKVEDQINFAGHETDGSMYVQASGGNGNLSYTATGLPPGIFLEPTNGTIYGTIEEGALANSPYRITVTIDDEDEIHSDAVSFNFNWTISPELTSQEWHFKNENRSYHPRHEGSFVQAGHEFYLMGGRESSTTIDIYDIENDSWRSLTEINPYSFNHFQAVYYQGLIWVIGAFENNDFPNETPASNIWMFDPVNELWIEGPEIPENRRRGSAGLVEYRGKFYVIGGNTDGHDGGYVNYFDSYDPETGEWTVLENAPRARDHFFAATIGSKLYAVSGRQSGGELGTFTPVLPEVDVYDFITQTWSTLPDSLDLPTPRAAAVVNNYLGKLIVAGGEVATDPLALPNVEMFDPLTQEWKILDTLNIGRHGTQGIVSGKGLYVVAGSPRRGGGNIGNMEYFGFDDPNTTPLVESELVVPETILVKKGKPKDISIGLTNGKTGVWIRSVELTGENAEDFEIVSGELVSNVLLRAEDAYNFTLDFVGEELTGSANLVITLRNDEEITIPIEADGNFEEVFLYYNTGSSANVELEGNTYLGDLSLTSIHNGGSVYRNGNVVGNELYKSERFAGYLTYQIEVPNGVYTVTTHHTETWFGLPNGGTAGPSKRVYDILLEDEIVKPNFDLFVENNNQPIALIFENIEVTDGVLDLSLIAKVNNATISGISIVNQGEIGAIPIVNITTSTVGGIVPVEVEFFNEISRPQDFTFAWDFGDGNTSTEQNPTHLFEEVGEFNVKLTVSSLGGDSATDSVTINAISPSEFELNVNAGSQFTVEQNGESYIGENNAGITFTSSNAYSSSSAGNPPLYLTERYAKNFTYSVPVENGVFTVKTYHNELWFGRDGREARPNQRVYDIYIEGELVRSNFDLFVENAYQPIELTHENIIVSDDTLNIQLVAIVNNANLSGFSIKAQDDLIVYPEALAEANTVNGPAPLTVTFDGGNSTGDGELTYEWNFENDSTSTEMQPEYTFNENGTYLVSLKVTDENGYMDTDELEIIVGDYIPVPTYSLSVNMGTNLTTSYMGTDFQGEATSGITIENSSIWSNLGAGDPELFLTERSGKNVTISAPVENGVYTIKTFHNELWFGKSGPASEVGQRVYTIMIEGEVVKNNFDLFAEYSNAPTELIFENIEVRDGELNLRLVALKNNATIVGLTIESLTSVSLPPFAIINSSDIEGAAPFEIAFDASASTGSGDLIYNWNFGDGESSTLINPTHLYDTAGTYSVILTVMDSAAMMDADTLEINIWDEAPIWSMYLNAGSDVNTSYQGKLFLGDKAFPTLFNSTKTYKNSSSSAIELYQTDRYGKSLAYNIPVDNGIYRVRTFHNELWFGNGGPAGQPGQRVFDILIEGVTVHEDFDLYVESNYEPTELVFEDIVVTDGEMNLGFIASANNASVSGIILERLDPNNGGEGANSRVMFEDDELADDADEDSNEELPKAKVSKATIYPNPAKYEAIISLPGEVSVKWINVYDVNGRLVLNFNAGNSNGSEYTLPLRKLEQGVYLVRLLGRDGVIDHLRLVINR
ncbi:malectin domain-containing carbohydrate-binding protein [Cyclobacterium amurskyense]|uniref:PKD domain containing protein n=1 Tax=Cyclobacterium amurskyense TaxID=320787 RepID=A0A0H4PFX0_9BACT|nr:malectin domain-containing carbohydrate-binding protein [Cyclobacterium amurskyense]AKP53381.1 PKD domain containing protein [Cyclobacterium amurskyense]